jgi:hypothetical protein
MKVFTVGRALDVPYSLVADVPTGSAGELKEWEVSAGFGNPTGSSFLRALKIFFQAMINKPPRMLRSEL